MKTLEASWVKRKTRRTVAKDQGLLIKAIWYALDGIGGVHMIVYAYNEKLAVPITL